MRPCCRGSAYSPVTAEVGGQYPSDAPFYPSEAEESRHPVVCRELVGSSPIRRTNLSPHSGIQSGWRNEMQYDVHRAVE